jgi:hypothetical protein
VDVGGGEDYNPRIFVRPLRYLACKTAHQTKLSYDAHVHKERGGKLPGHSVRSVLGRSKHSHPLPR